MSLVDPVQRFQGVPVASWWLALTIAGAGAGAGASEIRVYDGSLGTLPQTQGWLSYQPFLGSPAAIAGDGGVRLNTGVGGSAPPIGGAVGYTSHFPLPPFATRAVNPDWPVLDSGLGFSVSFVLRIFDEEHASGANRAGFSVVLLDQAHLGIELGFWEDSIWAQDGPGFVRGEAARFDTTALPVLYELTIRGLDYWLSADGTTLLSGTTRDYSPATPFPDPYGVPSYLFLGDDTGSAAADFFLGDIRLRVPESPVWALLGLGGALASLRVLTRRRGRGRAAPTGRPDGARPVR